MKTKFQAIKPQLIVLAAIAIILALAVGFVCVTNGQQIKFGINSKYETEFFVEVQVKVNGAYQTIFDSSDPSGVDYNANFIDSITGATINFANDSAAFADGNAHLKVISHDTNDVIACYINQTTTLTLDKATAGNSPAHEVSIPLSLPAMLGTIALSLQFDYAPQISVQLNPAGGDCDISSISGFSGLAYGTLPTPTKTGYSFAGWYTGENGTGTEITSATQISDGSNHTLYAHWSAYTYTITYNKNNADATGTTASSTHAYDTAKQLTANGFTLSGYKFIGWATSPTSEVVAYTDSQSVLNLTTIPNDTITLYALWEIMGHVITGTFDMTDCLSVIETYGPPDIKVCVVPVGVDFTVTNVQVYPTNSAQGEAVTQNADLVRFLTIDKLGEIWTFSTYANPGEKIYIYIQNTFICNPSPYVSYSPYWWTLAGIGSGLSDWTPTVTGSELEIVREATTNGLGYQYVLALTVGNSNVTFYSESVGATYSTEK